MRIDQAARVVALGGTAQLGDWTLFLGTDDQRLQLANEHGSRDLTLADVQSTEWRLVSKHAELPLDSAAKWLAAGFHVRRAYWDASTIVYVRASRLLTKCSTVGEASAYVPTINDLLACDWQVAEGYS